MGSLWRFSPFFRWRNSISSKKDEEERRRYRLIPRTFANWLQAFAILASVIGERAPENCSALFCYMDSIGEAYRVYGGTAWLRYDEQFRQRKAVRPSIRWDHKDISLWMRLMSAPRSSQPFRGAADSSGSTARPEKDAVGNLMREPVSSGLIVVSGMSAPAVEVHTACPTVSDGESLEVMKLSHEEGRLR